MGPEEFDYTHHKCRHCNTYIPNGGYPLNWGVEYVDYSHYESTCGPEAKARCKRKEDEEKRVKTMIEIGEQVPQLKTEIEQHKIANSKLTEQTRQLIQENQELKTINLALATTMTANQHPNPIQTSVCTNTATNATTNTSTNATPNVITNNKVKYSPEYVLVGHRQIPTGVYLFGKYRN